MDIVRFVILGLPRSGTTYLQTRLNAHPAIRCRGEMFDPWQIDDDGRKIRDRAALVARDRDPGGFLDAVLAEAARDGIGAVGIKVLFHHAPALFSRLLPERRDLRVIHLRRPNRLAQFASDLQVRKTGAWTAARGAARAPVRVTAGPAWAMSECNRLETEDFLLSAWLEGLPHRRLDLDYADLVAPGLDARLCAFLDQPDRALSSPLEKQGQNRVIDRFENADEIADYFRAVGRGDWLGPELPDGAAADR